LTDSPQELADTVHEAINAGTIKDRLTIQLDPDLRYGEVRIDDQILYTKLVDLPTVVESYKTIDNKSFYKSAVRSTRDCFSAPTLTPRLQKPHISAVLAPGQWSDIVPHSPVELFDLVFVERRAGAQ